MRFGSDSKPQQRPSSPMRRPSLKLRFVIALLCAVLLLIYALQTEPVRDLLLADHSFQWWHELDRSRADVADVADVARLLTEQLPPPPPGMGGGERRPPSGFVLRVLDRQRPIKAVFGTTRSSTRWLDAGALSRRLVDAVASRQLVYDEAIFVVSLEDADLYAATLDDSPAAAQTRLVLDRLLSTHRNLFFLHWNPAIVDARGAIGAHTIPIPDFDVVCRRVPSEIRFAERDARVTWRGTTTGLPARAGGDFSTTPRFRVVAAFQQLGTTLSSQSAHLPPPSAPPTVVGTSGPSGPPLTTTSTYPSPSLPSVLVKADVAFSGVVQGAVIPQEWIGGQLSVSRMSRSRVLIDVDGNANSWDGLRWRLASGAAVVKVDERRYTQWYYPDLVDGLHLKVAVLEPPPAAGSGVIVDSSAARVAATAMQLAANPAKASHLGVAGQKFAAARLQCEQYEKELDAALDFGPAFYRVARDWRIGGRRRPV